MGFTDKYVSTFRKLGIGENYFDLTFSDFHNQKVVKLCQNYLENFEQFCSNGLGLLFTGISGSGKTMLASMILMELVKTRGVVGSCLDLEQVLYLIGNQWKDEERKAEINRKLFLAPILMLDNVPFTLTKTRDVNEIMFLILSRRMKINRPTIITTIYDEDEMLRSFSKELRSLLTECTITVKLPPVDYRLKLPKHELAKKLLMRGVDESDKRNKK
jgi:DNA replication protein DnaC